MVPPEGTVDGGTTCAGGTTFLNSPLSWAARTSNISFIRASNSLAPSVDPVFLSEDPLPTNLYRLMEQLI